MNPENLFNQVRDLYDQLALSLTKEQSAKFLGMIADDAEQKANTIQSELDAEAEDLFDEETDEADEADEDDDDDDDDDEDDDEDGLAMWADDETDEDTE